MALEHAPAPVVCKTLLNASKYSQQVSTTTRPFTFTVDVALADEQHGQQGQQGQPHPAPASPPALLIPSADSTQVTWQALPETPFTANPLFAPTTTPSVEAQQEGACDGAPLAVAALGATPARDGAAQSPEQFPEQCPKQCPEQSPGTPTEQLLVADPADELPTAGPTKQQQRAFQYVMGPCLV